jgi:hypothetical protein
VDAARALGGGWGDPAPTAVGAEPETRPTRIEPPATSTRLGVPTGVLPLTTTSALPEVPPTTGAPPATGEASTTEVERVIRRTTVTTTMSTAAVTMSTEPMTMSTEPVTMSTESVTMRTEPVGMDEPATMESTSMTTMEGRFEIDRGWDDE